MRQYVGARYVPKFFDDGHGSTDWAGSSIVYDALTVVTHLGNSFTSKKPVPVGIDITNTDYWASTGIWNAQVEEYRQEVEDYAEILNRVVNHKYIFIGDSYNTTDTPPGGVPIVPWSETLVKCLGLSVADYYNIGNSGSGFVHGTPFIDLLNTISASVTDADEITDVVVLGGINDASEDATDVYNAMITFKDRVAALYPNAILTLGFISWTRTASGRSGMMPVIQNYEDMARWPNVRTITNAYKFYHYYGAMYQSDGHPNATGNRAIAMGVANFLKHGNTDIHWATADQNITWDASLNVTSGNLAVKFDQQNENVVTKINLPGWVMSSGFNMNSETTLTLGTFNYTVADFDTMQPIAGKMCVYNGQYYNIDVAVKFDHNTISIVPLEVEGGSGGTFSISGVTMFKLVVPTVFVTPIEYC